MGRKWVVNELVRENGFGGNGYEDVERDEGGDELGMAKCESWEDIVMGKMVCGGGEMRLAPRRKVHASGK